MIHHIITRLGGKIDRQRSYPKEKGAISQDSASRRRANPNPTGENPSPLKKETNHSSAKISSSPKNGSCRPLADILLNILARMPDNASSSSCVRPPSFWCFFDDAADSALLVMMTTPSRVAGHVSWSHMQPDGIHRNTPPAFVKPSTIPNVMPA